MKEEVILTILPHQLREVLKRENIDFQSIQEIRLRVGKPLILLYRGNEVIPEADGRPYYITKDEIREMLDYISGYSLYSYEREMSQGYITIEGGHRVGLSGQAIMENGRVKNLKYISSINVRMSHEILGCADIAGCYRGVAQNHLGIRTDVLDGCPKAEGMIMLIRSMRPEVIAVDEIGGSEDVHAIEYAMHCGCRMLATAHADSMEELQKKPVFDRLIREKRFERYVLLGNEPQIGTIQEIYDERGSLLYQDQEEKTAIC